MLTLGHLSLHNLQMDWSLDPIKKDDGLEMEADDEFPELQNLAAPDTVARHFEESLRRLSTKKNNGPTSNGYYPQSGPNELVPLMPWDDLDTKSVIPQTPAQLSPQLPQPPQPPQPTPPSPSPPHVNEMPQTTSHEQSLEPSSSSTELVIAPPPQTTPLPRPTPSPYDVENISNILKTIELNRFINSSIIIKNDVKEELPESTTNSSILSDNKVIKEEQPDSTQPESNGGVINNQKRTLSNKTCGVGVLQKKIKQDSPPPLLPLIPISTDVDIEAELPCTSIKQRPTAKKRPRKRKNGDTLPVKPPRPVGELKQSKRNTKRNTNYREASSDDEDMPKIAFNPRSRAIIKPVQPATVLPTVGEVKKEPTAAIIPQTVDTQVKTEPEIKTEADNEIKTELPPTPIEEIQEKVKVEITDEDEIEDVPGSSQPGSAQQPSAVKAKPSRVRNSAALGARKPKLHPLTRKEQLMMTKLQQSKEPFLQNLPCLKLASKISKCRECRCASLRSDSVFCRFYDFRRLRYKENAIIVLDGFSDPNKDPGPADIALWKPETPPKDIDMNVCRFILMHVGDQFCRIWHEEQTALEEHMSPNKTIAWKKVVKGVREICDVCETTLFNFHWTCSKCGFGVCIDCYKDRKRKRLKKIDKPQRGFDEYGWHTCTMRDTHEMIDLMLTQIIPGNSLNFLAHRLHEVCRLWKIPQRCNCAMSLGIQQVSFTPRLSDISVKIIKDAYLRFYSRECEVNYREKIKGLNPQDMKDRMQIMKAETELIKNAKSAGTLPIVLATTLKHLGRTTNADAFSLTDTVQMQDEVTKEYEEWAIKRRPQRYLPQKVMNLRKFQNMFPGIDHDWLCNGKLLRLLEARNSRNVMMFQEVWKRGQPVMVSELCKFLNISLWHPEAFCRDFGERKNDLINCMTGNLVPNQPMKLFWEGFQCVSKRLVDASGEPMLLKLKDWPPGDDFAEILPTRFADLMSALPLPEYTLRTGTLNIASRLPNIFVPPDLGPKMYNAYGSALHPDKGTTNLHLDISDAVNIMVYVGIPTDASAKAQIRAAMRAIDSGGCDLTTRRRVRQTGVMPGALWHIYSARDAEKIRDLLNRVTIERGFRLEPDHDPIHDQNWYLDNELRERLYDDYGVEGFPIVQCLGDAVFIPAGAPHQVRNLHNCIKVAEDFVSPENIEHCFHLSQQFRKLSMSHTNHEDKLQIRNVIYHAVKDTTSYLTYLLNRQL